MSKSVFRNLKFSVILRIFLVWIFCFGWTVGGYSQGWPKQPTAASSELSAERLWAITIFGGQLTPNNLGDVLWPVDGLVYSDTSFVGLALSREVWRHGGFAIELEGGVGQQFGGREDNDATQVWTGAFLRYDKFPWNHVIHTSIAGNLGVNYSSRRTHFENIKSEDRRTEKLQYYFAPEIAFSLPQHRQTELVFRVHHRSSAFGLFGCKGCGSNVTAVGLRWRF